MSGKIKHVVTTVGSGQTSLGIKGSSIYKEPLYHCIIHPPNHRHPLLIPDLPTHLAPVMLNKFHHDPAAFTQLMNIIKGKQICNANDDQKSPS
ncbi:hypothetical protein L1987_67615 [Smallanthus sonchifolius]|uniref:Uncharacterized protein n=1 Tax=Smallanthus sonchifolius TaxID=185202 RepID=A0ACB9B7G0_9ASTR|nr:hypothetical protein L1987_67615 [Smallanthus sonchifolius]